MNGAVVKQPAEQRLVHVHRLNLVHVHFHGVARDKTALINDAPIRNGELGDPAYKPSSHKTDDGDAAEEGDSDKKKVMKRTSILKSIFCYRKNNSGEEREESEESRHIEYPV